MPTASSSNVTNHHNQKFDWGFIGAPIAVAVTENLLPLFLFLYVRFVDGRQCWGGFSRQALKNWGPMIRLALPGLVMVLAEFMAFEILTLSASWISTTHLAAQSILTTITAITYQIPFPVSIAASTRIANLIGATLSDAAKTAGMVAFVASFGIGLLNVTLLSSLRNYIAPLFTNDDDVIQVVVGVLPLCAAFQLFDALAACCGGILRGIGRQEIGGYVNLISYYAIGLPISFFTGFRLGWGLYGLWAVSSNFGMNTDGSDTNRVLLRVPLLHSALLLPSRWSSSGRLAGRMLLRMRRRGILRATRSNQKRFDFVRAFAGRFSI